MIPASRSIFFKYKIKRLDRIIKKITFENPTHCLEYCNKRKKCEKSIPRCDTRVEMANKLFFYFSYALCLKKKMTV